jgi:hypothetical protein
VPEYSPDFKLKSAKSPTLGSLAKTLKLKTTNRLKKIFINSSIKCGVRIEIKSEIEKRTN